VEENEKKIAAIAEDEGKILTLKNKIDELEKTKETFVTRLQNTEDKASEACKRANNQQAIAEDLMHKLRELEKKYAADMAEKEESLVDNARKNIEKESATIKLQMEAALAQLKLVKDENIGFVKKMYASRKKCRYNVTRK